MIDGTEYANKPARFNVRLPNFRATLSRKLVAWGLTLHKEGSVERFARDELERAGWFKPDGLYGDMMGRAVLNMMKLFSMEGHSGMSASLATGLFKKLARFEPLMPLTGENNEWTEVSEGRWQNKRCSRVFKDKDGRAYDIEGRVFREPSGACYTSGESRVYISFPYTPTTEYVDRAASHD